LALLFVGGVLSYIGEGIVIIEQATVVESDDKSLLVETIQQSSCGSCVAQKGCGQGVLAKYLTTSSYFRVCRDLEDERVFKPGDVVELGIDELALVRASLWLYLVPLASMLVGAYIGNLVSEGASIFLAAAGLVFGGYLCSRHAKRVRNQPEYAPRLVSEVSSVRFVESGILS